jgi:hypothetical protein
MSTSSAVSSAADLVAGFPKPVLSVVAVIGESVPTFATLKTLQQELNENAQSIQSDLGDGLSGHLVLTASPAVFAAMDNHVPFIVPVNPGTTVNVADGPTAAILHVRMENHRNSLRNFHMYRNTDLALKQQLLQACPATFFETLRHPDFGFARVSTLQLLTHLHTTYGKVSPTDIMKKQNELNTPFWNPPIPLETLFADILKKRDYLISNGSLVDPNSLVNSAYLNFEATGLYTTDCKTWRDKPAEEKTWANIVKFFTAAETDRTRVTALDMNYHSANAVTPAPTPTICAPTATTTSDPTLAALLANVVAVNKLLTQQQSRRRGANNRSTGNGNSNTQPILQAANPRSSQNTNGKSWCHTHGYSDNFRHNSKTCRNKGPNHIDQATAPHPSHPNGGSTYVYSDLDSRYAHAAIE